MIKKRSVKQVKFLVVLFFTVITGVNVLGGCSASRADLGPYQYPLSPNARFYSYLMINGIAQGALLTGEKPRGALPVLEQADKKARLAVLAFMEHKKGQNAFQTDLILTRYLSEIRN
ncbi:hypothetical protein PT277_04875 [Acetobacteraceae bacterium ESL0709]|nr:hypothetical protein [Acetobacteraceae bacterium ESL0697]MDF7678028.1 hypothetical protein [Acetobacteraceae bacterium ESL0709]